MYKNVGYQVILEYFKSIVYSKTLKKIDEKTLGLIVLKLIKLTLKIKKY